MNAPAVFPTVSDTAVPTGWSGLNGAANLWRGRCLHLFARAEAAVSETLLVLAKDVGSEVALPLMVGPRFDELDRILAGRADAVARAALTALRGIRPHDRLRVFLCHGVATVLADQNGGWHVRFDLLAFRNGAAARDELFLSGETADARYRALNTDSQRLVQKLAALRTPVTP